MKIAQMQAMNVTVCTMKLLIMCDHHHKRHKQMVERSHLRTNINPPAIRADATAITAAAATATTGT